MTLEFGVFDPTAIIDAEDPLVTAQAYEDHLGDAQLAERLGYAYFFFIEHQNAGFPCISSPTVLSNNVWATTYCSSTTNLRRCRASST
jgi:alkanesulfonate monooxygenase SsuD/methylene tetrahydromethanopterin reductase-like flavin-dependent oxidoreductase (luciferase family)